MTLSKSEQLFLFELLKHKELTKLQQNIFSSTAFYRSISKLKQINVIDSRISKNNHKENIYFLTIDGLVIATIIARALKQNEYDRSFIILY